jgi:hypothetical protein
LPHDSSIIFAAARKAAAAADVTVVALGLTCKTVDADSNGRCGVVLSIVGGSAATFNESLANAALYTWYGGEEAGTAL